MAQITAMSSGRPLKEFRKRWRSILMRKCKEIETTSLEAFHGNPTYLDKEEPDYAT